MQLPARQTAADRPVRRPVRRGRWHAWLLLVLGWVVGHAATPVFSPTAMALATADVEPAAIPAHVQARRTLAQIQSELERVAAGHARAQGELAPHDALASIVDAYAAFLAADPAALDHALTQVAATAALRRVYNDSRASLYEHKQAEQRVIYFQRIDAALRERDPLLRLQGGMRLVDAVLFLEATDFGSGDLEGRTSFNGLAATEAPLNAIWLYLPCRSVIGRAADFRRNEAALKAIGGPILGCPSTDTDWASLEAQARAPATFTPYAARTTRAAAMAGTARAPTQTWQDWLRSFAVAHMDEYPGLLAPVLAAAAERDALGKLDYAVFLHTFQPADEARDTRIRELLATLHATPVEDGACCNEPPDANDAVYDGSDASLVSNIVWASSSGVVNSESAFYAVPCAVLQARAPLLDAIKERYGSNRDNFLPRSGCSWGRGELHGFPDDQLHEFVALAEEADNHFIDHYQGSMRFGMEANQATALETLKLNPRAYLGQPAPAFDYPYQTWGYLSLANHTLAMRIRQQYIPLRAAVATRYRQAGLSNDEATAAAAKALFAGVWGADCGAAVPKGSLRQALLEDLPYAHLLPAEGAPDPVDPPEIEECARFASHDPLLLVAVANPAALARLLDAGRDVDVRNAYGKTALMVAAQFNRLDSARLLLAHHAQINASTLQAGASYEITLAHDGRSALMYAAANASLPLIELLLAAGADPYQADTKGARAIDYLLGYGPTAANPQLDAVQRAKAAKLLF